MVITSNYNKYNLYKTQEVAERVFKWRERAVKRETKSTTAISNFQGIFESGCLLRRPRSKPGRLTYFWRQSKCLPTLLATSAPHAAVCVQSSFTAQKETRRAV